ncbi:MAG: hypothetical protein ACXWC9_07205 [Pseudobdellovibrionaceae bacterium]
MGAKLFLLFPIILSVQASAKVFEMSESGADVKIPIQIWNQLAPVGGKEAVGFSALTVRLVEKSPGVLIDSEVEVKFPRGGGEIDLAHFVKGQSGSFRVFFQLEDSGPDDQMRAYFISRARKRKIEGEVWGAGCNKYMNIKSYILGEGRTKGIEVNTTRNRHDSVLGGTFFFSNGNQVTQVTFKDSNQAHLFCDSAQQAAE